MLSHSGRNAVKRRPELPSMSSGPPVYVTRALPGDRVAAATHRDDVATMQWAVENCGCHDKITLV